jgi:hypothetical protein
MVTDYFDGNTLAEYKARNADVSIVDVAEFDLLKADFPLFIWFMRTGPSTSKMAFSKKKPKHKAQQIKDIKDYTKNGAKIPYLTPGST